MKKSYHLSLCLTVMVFLFMNEAVAFPLTKKDERGKIETVEYVVTKENFKAKLKEWQNKLKGIGTCSLYDSDEKMECRCNTGLFWQGDDGYGHKGTCDKRIYYLKMVDKSGKDYVMLQTANKKLTNETKFITDHFKGTASCSLGTEKQGKEDNEVITCKCNGELVKAKITDRYGDSAKNIWYKPERFRCACNAGYHPVGTSCLGCTAGFYSEDGVECKACGKGTYASGFNNTSCKKCPANSICTGLLDGVEVNNGATGFECKDGFIEKNGACVSNVSCPKGQYNNGTACKSCPTGCSACSSASVCTACKTGYTKSGNSCVKNTCKEGYGYRQQRIDNDELKWNAGCYPQGTCLKDRGKEYTCMFVNSIGRGLCSSDSVYTSTVCSVCNAGYYYTNGDCKPCPERCLTCTSAKSCSACEAGYVLKNDMCLKPYTLKMQDELGPFSSDKYYNDTEMDLGKVAEKQQFGKTYTCSADIPSSTVTCLCAANDFLDEEHCKTVHPDEGICLKIKDDTECNVKWLSGTVESCEEPWLHMSADGTYCSTGK